MKDPAGPALCGTICTMQTYSNIIPSRLCRYTITNDGCWEWAGALNSQGYGVVRWEGRQKYIHRVIFDLVKGPIPQGHHIDHTCRNRRCMNPEHLEAVTKQENDRRRPGTKVDPSMVRAIRRLAAEGMTGVAIAARFGLSQNHTSAILNGRYWADV